MKPFTKKTEEEKVEHALAKFRAEAKSMDFFGDRLTLLKPQTSNPRKSLQLLISQGVLVSCTLRAGGEVSTYLVEM